MRCMNTLNGCGCLLWLATVGGLFVLGPESLTAGKSASDLRSVIFSHVNQSTGDHANMKQVLEAIDRADAAAAASSTTTSATAKQ
jgi:hypothetical protein